MTDLRNRIKPQSRTERPIVVLVLYDEICHFHTKWLNQKNMHVFSIVDVKYK